MCPELPADPPMSFSSCLNDAVMLSACWAQYLTDAGLLLLLLLLRTFI